MRIRYVSEHLLAYWNSLRGTDQHEKTTSLRACLQCPVFVINLERSPHRRDYMRNYLAGYGIDAHIFPAVDGKALDIAQLKDQGIYDDAVAHQKFARTLSPAEIACTLSHLNVYKKMVDENIPMALILEDDAMFAPETSRRLCGALAEAPADWDVLQLFHNCDEHVSITEHLVRFPSKSHMPVGSAGYLIRKAGAEKMLSNGYPVCYPADSLMGRSYRWGVNLYGFVPPAIVQNAIFPTQIYGHSSWAIKIIQTLKQGLVSVFGSIARALRGSN